MSQGNSYYCFQGCPCNECVTVRAIDQLTACIRDMVGALEFYAKAPCAPEILDVAPKFRQPATEVLNKHADLIGKLKGEHE